MRKETFRDSDKTRLKKRMHALDKRKGARVGDWLINGKKVSRITYIWRDEKGKVLQIQDGGGGASFYLGGGYVSYSGSLDTGVKSPTLERQRKKKGGLVWFFKKDVHMASNGTEFFVPFRVYKVVKRGR